MGELVWAGVYGSAFPAGAYLVSGFLGWLLVSGFLGLGSGNLVWCFLLDGVFWICCDFGFWTAVGLGGCWRLVLVVGGFWFAFPGRGLLFTGCFYFVWGWYNIV